MSLIITSLLYSIAFLILTTKEFITDKYDHDIDQFMYFGSRALHGELIWTKEFDDKSPVVQYIFSIPAALKETSIFVLITLIISISAAYISYKMLLDIVKNSGLELNDNEERSIVYFSSIFYLILLVCIYGSFHHINAISASLCLISIALTYINRKKNNKVLINISAIASAISISIRPYYLLNLMILPMWITIREGEFKSYKKNNILLKKYFKNIRYLINWIILITFYIILFNLTPYLWKGNLSDFIYGIKLNSVDYINHNIFNRQYVNIGRNPILYPAIACMTILPFVRIIFRKVIYEYYQKIETGLEKLNKLDIDIIFFGIISPGLLELMFYRKHFFGHYFTLFCPYILITIVILLAILAKLNRIIQNFKILKKIIKSIFIILLVGCLITNQSIPNTINELYKRKPSEKSRKVQLIKEFVDDKRLKNEKIGFLVPESNYIHWKLDESRHGFPQKAVFINIAKGRMDSVIDKYDKLNYSFLLPTKTRLCKTLNLNAPEYVITKKNDYSFNCLKENSSNYKLLSQTLKLNENNIFIFKRKNE